MIHEHMSRLLHYIPDNQRKYVAGFLEKISEGMEEGEYEIKGNHVFARIMSYPLKEAKDCDIEAHNIYRDIQFTLIGNEGISVFKRENLEQASNYNEEKDIIFFQKEEGCPFINIINEPGYFTMLLPNEAHRPQEMTAGVKKVIKKVVIKIKEELYEN